VLCVGELHHSSTPLTERLAFLLAGGLLGALTTRLTGGDPLPVTSPPGAPLAVTETPPDRTRIKLRDEPAYPADPPL
jgi:hypothetical protein